MFLPSVPDYELRLGISDFPEYSYKAIHLKVKELFRQLPPGEQAKIRNDFGSELLELYTKVLAG